MPPPISGSTPVTVICLENNTVSAREDVVATEEPLEIQISHQRRGNRIIKPLSVTMRTPGHDLELAVGFIYSEGLFQKMEQIEDVSKVFSNDEQTNHGNVVRIVFRDGMELDLPSLERHFYTTSSCGVCGKTSLEALRFTGRISLQPGVPTVSARIIHDLPKRLRKAQTIFEQTGGLHAAALFDREGKLLNVREDVGRHNAVDKLIGAELMAGRTDFSEFLMFVSGRTSFELMQKTLMAGIPILASVGAPSSLAVELARQFGATLLGFVREDRCNIYSGSERFRDAFQPTSSV